MKTLKNILCRIIGHKIFDDSGRECCLRCNQDSFYNLYFYTTIPNIAISLYEKVKSIKPKSKSELPF